MEENEFNLKTKINPDTGDITISVFDILNEMSEDQKRDLLYYNEYAWWSFVTHAMAEDIVTQFSREHYCPEYTKLRGMILNSESMPKVIREWALSLTNSVASAKEGEDYWMSAYYDLYRYMREYFDRIDMRFEFPKMPTRKYDKEYSKELMAKVEEKIIEWKNEFPDQEPPEID